MNELHDPLIHVRFTQMAETVIPIFRAMNKLMRKGRIEAVNATGPYPNELDNHIAWLCGYKDGADMALNISDETLATFDLFDQADLDTAYILYKALEAKRK